MLSVCVCVLAEMCLIDLCVFAGRMQGEEGVLEIKAVTELHWKQFSTQHVRSAAAKVQHASNPKGTSRFLQF